VYFKGCENCCKSIRCARFEASSGAGWKYINHLTHVVIDAQIDKLSDATMEAETKTVLKSLEKRVAKR